jgi:hypothetical protein
MLEKTIMLFDDHYKKIVYGLCGVFIIAMITGPLLRALEAFKWDV